MIEPGTLVLADIPADERILLATDRLDFNQAMRLANLIGRKCGSMKVHSFVDEYGPNGIYWLRGSGAKKIWIDYKLHDTPDTVAERAEKLFMAGADIVTVMAAGGSEMMCAAVKVANAHGKKIFAVTVPTSMGDEECKYIYGRVREPQCARLAYLAALAGVHGIVCSAHEIKSVRAQTQAAARTLGIMDNIEIVCPGIRLPGNDPNDQKMIDTPGNTIRKGATRLVIGRAITKAEDPVAVVAAIEREIAEVLQTISNAGLSARSDAP